MTALAHHALMVVGGGGSPGAYVAALMALSPIGLWKLDEVSGTTAAAMAGGIGGTFEGTDITLSNAAIVPSDPTLRCPKFGTAPTTATVSGGDAVWSRVTIGTSANFQTASNFTYLAIIRPNTVTAISAGQTFISHGAAGPAIRHSSSTAGDLNVLKSQQASRLLYNAGLNAGQSYHIAFRVTAAGVLTLHVNGVLVATGTTGGDYGSPARPLRIGVDAQNASDNLQSPFQGWISCPAIFTALSDADILSLAQAAGLA